MGSMRVLHAFLCLVRWSKLQLQGRRCICIVSRSWWWSKPAVVVWAKSAEGGSSQKLSLLVFLANAANEQFRKRKHFNINTLQNRWKLMYCRTLKTPRLCPKLMCSYSGHNATVRICVLISTTSRPYVLKIFCEGCGMMNVNVWYSKDFKVPCCSSLHLFLPNNRTATMTSGAAFVSYFLRWDEILQLFGGRRISDSAAQNCRRNIFFIRSERIILVVSPLARPPANSCETMLLSSTPFLFPKAAPVWVLHSAPVCDTVWVGRGVQLGPARVSSLLYSTRVQRSKC